MTRNKNPDEVIGYIYKLKNDSLKNDSREIFWSDLELHDLIYFGDAVQTQMFSSVHIKFTNQQVLSIEPETLVRFNKKDDDISLDLVQGEIAISEANEIPAESSDIDTPRKPKLDNKKLFIKTPQSFVDSKKEKIFKINRKRESVVENNDNPLFIQAYDIPNLKFDDDSLKTEKLIPSIEKTNREPTSTIDDTAQEPSLAAPETSPTVTVPTVNLPLSIPKIKKMKLTADE